MGEKNSIRKVLKEYGIISLGLVFYSFGFTQLLVPAETVPGGTGGISSLIYFALGSPSSFLLSFSMLYFYVNTLLLLLGVLVIGPRFGFKTIFAIVVNTLFMSLMETYIPDGILGLSSETDKLLMVILGGVMAAIGVATCFIQGGSSGGTDIIAMIVNKYRNISLGKVIMFCDVAIVTSSLFVFGQVKPAIYGLVTMAVVGYTIDMMMSGSKQSFQLFVFSPKFQEIGKRVIAEAHRGVTYLDAVGGYTEQQQKVVLIICRKTEISQIYQIIRDVDQNAFISSANVNGVYGQGFEVLDPKKKKTNPTKDTKLG